MIKTCSNCKKDKSLDQFHRRSSSKDGLQSRCKECNLTQRRAYYRTAKGKDSNILSGKRNYVKNRRKVFEILQQKSCVDCGEDDPVVLEWDHIDPTKKNGELSSNKILSRSWAKIEQEINKCEVRCANCHRRKTARERNWFKAGQ